MASPVDTSVKFFHDDMPGAPVLTDLAGSLISVLDACLGTGFGLRSVVSLSVLDGVATLALASDVKNANLLHAVVLVDGASVAALNGEQRVTFASSTELKYATAAPNGTATGTITVKSAPAGWSKVFSGTNKAAYKSLDVQSLGMLLRVDDTTTQHSAVRGYEVMSDVDSGTGPFPTLADVSNSNGFWAKCNTASTTTAKWSLFADARLLYWCPAAYSRNGTATGQAAYWFGDIVPYKSGDAFAASISSSRATPDNNAPVGSVFHGGQAGTPAACRFARSYTGLGSAVSAHASPLTGGLAGGYSGADPTLGVFPPPTDGKLRLSKIGVTEQGVAGNVTAFLRGEMPGAYYCPQFELYKFFQRRDTVVADGRRMAVVHAGQFFSQTPADTNASGRGFFDITGPWR